MKYDTNVTPLFDRKVKKTHIFFTKTVVKKNLTKREEFHIKLIR